ncbi:MAG TPA: LysE/ArgO family amino acid transporter [Povalibacter sp.]
MTHPAFMTGLVLSATLIVAIGAQNAFVLRQGLRREHVVAIVVFCVLADFALITAGVVGLAAVLGDAPLLTTILTIGGVIFLAIYGIRALMNAWQPRSLDAQVSEPRMTLRSALAQTAAFTFLNPHVYLDTVLLVGSIGARQPPDLRLWFIGGAAVASAGWFSALGFGARLLVPLFARPIAWRILDALVGLTMLTLAGLLARQALA